MIFKDREDAGKKLSEALLKDKSLLRGKKDVIVVSLLRGGVIIGKVIAKQLKIKEIALLVTKIVSPYNPELAIGALCFNIIFLQKEIIKQLDLKKETLQVQISIARIKHNEYVKRFQLNRIQYRKQLRNKIVIIVDDGIATGATTEAARRFAKSKRPKKIILGVPVGPVDFNKKGFNKVFILHKDSAFSSVSQFYESFPQVNNQVVI